MGLPLQDFAVIDALGTDLRNVGYGADGVAEVLGEAAALALERNLYWPALRATIAPAPELQRLATVVRLFLLGTAEPVEHIDAALPTVGLDALVEQGVLLPGDGGLRAALDIRPHGNEDAEFLVIADQDAAARTTPLSSDHVLGIGSASISLAQAVIRRPVARALDLGTGSGIQALHLDAHCDQVVATDTNPRALALAAATARINGMAWDLRQGSLYEPLDGERFDLIVANPPFVVGSGVRDYEYRDSGLAGDAVSENVIAGAADHLNPGGVAQLLANWMVHDRANWSERIGAWVEATGLDAWVVQRELADPMDYVSMWLADAGESAAVVAQRGAAWLDWFEANGVVGIGMGMVTLRRPLTERAPEVVLEQITAPGQRVTGVEVAGFLDRRDYLREHSDEQLLATRFSTEPVILETQSLPGSQGWQEVSATVTRPGGPGAVLAVDEVMTALLAGCRGEVPLGTLIGLLADHHGVAADALAAAALPEVRAAIAKGILYQAD